MWWEYPLQRHLHSSREKTLPLVELPRRQSLCHIFTSTHKQQTRKTKGTGDSTNNLDQEHNYVLNLDSVY